MAGQQEPYFYIEFVSHKQRELANGRTIHVPVATYYIKRDEEVQERHRAAFLTQDLAEQIKARYPEKNPKIHQDSRYVYDDTTPLLSTLAQVGEGASTSVPVLEEALRDVLRDVSKTEILTICNRVLGES